MLYAVQKSSLPGAFSSWHVNGADHSVIGKITNVPQNLSNRRKPRVIENEQPTDIKQSIKVEKIEQCVLEPVETIDQRKVKPPP